MHYATIFLARHSRGNASENWRIRKDLPLNEEPESCVLCGGQKDTNRVARRNQPHPTSWTGLEAASVACCLSRISGPPTELEMLREKLVLRLMSPEYLSCVNHGG